MTETNKTTEQEQQQGVLSSVDKAVDRKLVTLKEYLDVAAKHGFAYFFGTVVTIYVLVPMADKHGQFIDRVGVAVEKLSETTVSIDASTRNSTEAIRQSAAVLEEIRSNDGTSGQLADKHLRITEEIRDDVIDIHKAVVKPAPNATRPK